jgi:hypothetical protein
MTVALDSIAARAVATAVIDSSGVKLGEPQRTRAIDGTAAFVLAIFKGITTNAVVTVAPGTFSAGPDPVVGSGTGAIT